jgi:adenine deaminase
VVFDNLKKPVARQVYKKGLLVAENGKYLGRKSEIVPQPRSTMNLRYRPADFQVKAEARGKIKVIEIVPEQIVTKQILAAPKVEAGKIVADVGRDILKLVVVERHGATGNVGVGFVRGFKLKSGALGSTVAHDAHNVVVVGTNDGDIQCVIEELLQLKGGLVAVAHGKVKAALGLPIAGLVSDQPLADVIKKMDALNAAAHALGSDLEAPFMTLSFLSLSPIPELKLTDQGLIDAVHLRKTSLYA